MNTRSYFEPCNYVTHLSNLREVQTRYVQAANVATFEGLLDLELKEQFENTLSPNVKSFVCSREPKCAEDSAKAADLFYTMAKAGNDHAHFAQASNVRYGTPSNTVYGTK